MSEGFKHSYDANVQLCCCRSDQDMHPPAPQGESLQQETIHEDMSLESDPYAHSHHRHAKREDEENHHPQAPPVPHVYSDDLFPIITGRLSFAIHATTEDTLRLIHARPALFFFSSCWQESYAPMCLDFGPINLAAVHTFCEELEGWLSDKRILRRHLVFYCDNRQDVVLNAMFLLGAFLVLRRRLPLHAALLPLLPLLPALAPEFRYFRDATYARSCSRLSLADALQGLHAAHRSHVYEPSNFCTDEYLQYDDPRVADLHQPCAKFLAFRGPSSKPEQRGFAHPPARYLDVFRAKGVTDVIRLNESEYDGAEFERAGLRFHDLPFQDCSVPPPEVVEKFMAVTDSAEGVVAVHCKAGLGRTGTLIALWLMRTQRWGAGAAVGWVRVVRPGSVIGLQHAFLQGCENARWDGPRLLGSAPKNGGSDTENGGSDTKNGGDLQAGGRLGSPRCGGASESSSEDGDLDPGGHVTFDHVPPPSELARHVTAALRARGATVAPT